MVSIDVSNRGKRWSETDSERLKTLYGKNHRLRRDSRKINTATSEGRRALHVFFLLKLDNKKKDFLP